MTSKALREGGGLRRGAVQPGLGSEAPGRRARRDRGVREGQGRGPRRERLERAAGAHVEALWHIADLAAAAGDTAAAAAAFEKVAAPCRQRPAPSGQARRRARSRLRTTRRRWRTTSEAHRAYPADTHTLAWLGTFHARCERFERRAGSLTRRGRARPPPRAPSGAWPRRAARAQERRRDAALRRYDDARRVPGRRGVPPAPRARLRGPRHGRGRQEVRREAARHGARAGAKESARPETTGARKRPSSPSRRRRARQPETTRVHSADVPAPASPSPLDRSRSGMSEDEWGCGPGVAGDVAERGGPRRNASLTFFFSIYLTQDYGGSLRLLFPTIIVPYDYSSRAHAAEDGNACAAWSPGR